MPEFSFEEATTSEAPASPSKGFSFEEATQPISPESFEGQLAAQGITQKQYEKTMAAVQAEAPKEPAPGFFGGARQGFGHAFEATAKGPGVFTLSNELLGQELRRKEEEAAGREPPGGAGKVGEFVGGLGGTLAQAIPIGIIAKKPGISAMFASAGAYDAFIRAGTRALAEGKSLDEAVDIGKKTAVVGGLAQAAVAAALPGGAPASLGEALVSGIRPGAAAAGAVGAENITQRALGLKTPVSEGMIPAALTMGLLPAGGKLASMAYAKVFVPRSIQALEETPTQEIPYRVPSSLETGVLQPAGAATFVTDPLGRTLPFGQLSPMEQTEAMRGPRSFTPREEQVRAAATPAPVIGASRAAELAQQQPEIIQPPPEIVAANQAATAPSMTEAGGEVSFGAQAQAQGIPNARQGVPPQTAEAIAREKFSENQMANALTEASAKEASPAVQQQARVKLEMWADNWVQARINRIAESGVTETVEPAGFTAIDELIARARLTEDPKLIGPLDELRQVTSARKEEPLGGQVSFGAPAEAKAIPSARQTAQEQPGIIKGTKLEQWADRIIGEDPRTKTRMGLDPLEDAKRIAAWSIKGAALVEQGVRNFAAWAKEMMATYGLQIQPHLRDLFNRSLNIYSSRKPSVEAPPRQALGITPNPQVTEMLGKAWDNITSLRDKLANAWRARPNKQVAAATKDAADNQSKLAGDQVSNGLKLIAQRDFGDQASQALDAVMPMVQSGGDKQILARFISQATGVEGGTKARQAAEFALANFNQIQGLAARFQGDMQAQFNAESGAGMAPEFRENYFPQVFDPNKLPNQGEEFFTGAGKGGGGRFRAARKFDTIYDAVEAGYGKAIKSMNAADVAASRVRGGMNKVMDSAWADSFRTIEDPTTRAPLVTDVVVDRNGQRLAPNGYELVELFPGKTIAVHKGYSNFFDALTGRSKIEAFEMLGLPVGKAALQAEAAIKHGMLFFDTFHASRIIQKAVFLSPGNFGPQLKNIPQFARKGRALLEYSDRDLQEAVRQNEITPEIAAAVRAARPTANLLISRGLNVGQVQEALRSDIIRNIRGLGTFNKWVFEKVTRGALMEGGLVEFDRVKRNNPSWSDARVADQVVKDINAMFGNLGRQGLFTSAGARDLARLAFLAPQWVESMARSEAYGYGQLLKAPFTGNLGTMAKGMATGLGAYFVGAQVLNMITKGHPTWENEEEDHKLDAWIPDVTGKTAGFWMSPFSVPAELTHDVIRYANKKEGAREVGMQIVRNKMSPFTRAAWTMATGRNYADYKIGDTWKTAKEAAYSLAPTPIPLAGTFKGYPGQMQRQLLGSAGVKVEPAETAIAQIRDKADRFRQAQPNARPDEGHFDAYVESAYGNLRQALRSKNETQVADAIAQLRKNRSDADIQKAMLRTVKNPFTGKKALEKPFFNSLSDKEQELYDRAVEERLENLDLFLKVWAERE